MSAEFRYGDRVRWPHQSSYLNDEYPPPLGTVVDERQQDMVMGDYDACLPQPVAVLWDEPGEVWWSPGNELELA